MNTTRKKQKKPIIQGEIIDTKEGWIKIRIYGKSYERGYAHGFLLHKELTEVKRSFTFLVNKYIKIRATAKFYCLKLQEWRNSLFDFNPLNLQ